MARRTAHLCIGLPGALGARTTADLLAGHADTLAVTGHHLAADQATSRRAAWELTRDNAALASAGLRRRDVEGTWEGVWRRAYRTRARDAVLAEDALAVATPDQVALCLDALAGFRTHLVVLAADPAEVLARTWTDAVRRGAPMPLLRYVERLGAEPRPPSTPGSGHSDADRWWDAHHLGDVLRRWAPQVRPDRVHVVVLTGGEGARADQAGDALGRLLDTSPLTPVSPARAAGTGDIDDVASRPLPSAVLDALRTESARWADQLRASPYDVIGDPSALVAPEATTGPGPLTRVQRRRPVAR